MMRPDEHALFTKFTGIKFVKYKNKKTQIDGITFDSKKEAERYKVLKSMQADGLINDLECQPKFMLIPSQYFDTTGRRERGVDYVADFRYKDNLGQIIVEDVKSAITAKDKVYRIKRKMVKYFHDVEIIEV